MDTEPFCMQKFVESNPQKFDPDFLEFLESNDQETS